MSYLHLRQLKMCRYSEQTSLNVQKLSFLDNSWKKCLKQSSMMFIFSRRFRKKCRLLPWLFSFRRTLFSFPTLWQIFSFVPLFPGGPNLAKHLTVPPGKFFVLRRNFPTKIVIPFPFRVKWITFGKENTGSFRDASISFSCIKKSLGIPR